MHNLLPRSKDGLQWNDEVALPYFNYFSPKDSTRHYVSFAGVNSTALRSAYAREAGLGGVGIWTADAVDALDYPEDGEAMWGALL